MLERLTLKQLRSLQAIAACGSLADAARHQALSSPAIHSQIKKMEDVLGQATLTRDATDKKLVPTAHGQVLIDATRQIDAILERARDNLDALSRGNRGHVRLGFESTGRLFAARLVATLQKTCPDIEISFTVANRARIIEDLATGQIELAIMGRPPRVPRAEAVPVGSHPFGVFVAPDSPLADMQDYAPEELVQHTVLAREKGSTTRILLDRFLDRIEGYGTPRIVEMDSNETIKEGVIAGLGVAMLSLHVVEREMRQALLHQLAWPGLPIMRYWYLVVPDGPKILESTHRIEEAIRALNGSFLPPQMRPA